MDSAHIRGHSSTAMWSHRNENKNQDRRCTCNVTLKRLVSFLHWSVLICSYTRGGHTVDIQSCVCVMLLLSIVFIWRTSCRCRPGSSVGIATGYGLDGPGIEVRWRRDCPHLFRPALGPTQPPVQWVPGLSRGYKAAGAWRWPLTPF
jgi:hypothetical protein